jgi:prepilin-type N-terminal cleavage/methylation domain-containing protein
VRNATSTSRSRLAFTLVELLVGVAIIAVLAALLLAGVTRAVERAKSASAQRSVDSVVQAIGQFKSQFGFLPPLVHDGAVISAGSNEIRPSTPVAGSVQDGPVAEINTGDVQFRQLVVWSEGADNAFFRRRRGSGADPVEMIPGGSVWNPDTAWDDRRYSKFALPFYLTGVADKDLDGVRGPGMARPQSNGTFLGVGYPVGSSRDRYEPVIEGDKESLRVVTGYFEAEEYAEHGQSAPSDPAPEDTHQAYVDPWGRAIRYYRWESGRLEAGRLVVETSLDLNIPPVLFDPETYAGLANNDANAVGEDLTNGSAELRAARFAVVSAGPDGVFGTEEIDFIADTLRLTRATTPAQAATLRKRAWEDNIVGLGN